MIWRHDSNQPQLYAKHTRVLGGGGGLERGGISSTSRWIRRCEFWTNEWSLEGELLDDHPVPFVHVSRMARAARAILKRIPVQRGAHHTQTEPAPVPAQTTQESRAQADWVPVHGGCIETRQRFQRMHRRPACPLLRVFEPRDEGATILRERRGLQLGEQLQDGHARLPIAVIEPREHGASVLREPRRLELAEHDDRGLAHVLIRMLKLCDDGVGVLRECRWLELAERGHRLLAHVPVRVLELRKHGVGVLRKRRRLQMTERLQRPLAHLKNKNQR